MKFVRRLLLCTVVSVALLPLTMAQNINAATVLGVVTDPSGAVVPKAKVELLDIATGKTRSVATNDSGRYSFSAVNPGNYTVKASAQGFRTTTSNFNVSVGKSYDMDLQLAVGNAQETVEVTGNVGTELQTMDATIGSTLGGDTLAMLPSQQRNVSSLMLLQPASVPQQQGNQTASVGGQVAGAQSDQNTIILDGANITNGVSGNSDYYTNFRGGPEGPIPTPVESIQEFKVSTNNPNASFAGASGSQVMLVTKRGSNQFHGSGYEYFQGDNLNANTWDRNFRNQPIPPSKDNRYGGSLGGYIPGLPEKYKTYFYANYEGRRRSQVTQVQKLVPSPTLRQGILRFRDASGNIVSYDLATSTQCGSSGTAQCDPLGLGLNPVVSQIWQMMPQGNDTSNASADGLNTLGFSGAADLPIRENFGVLRLDHSISKNWQLMTTYRYYEQDAAVDKQIDIGGLLAGDTSGKAASAASIPRQPRMLVAALSGQFSQNLTNQFNASFLRDWWQWDTAGATPQVSGTAAALQIGGEAQTTALVPMNVDTNSVRTRMWDGHNWSLRDDVAWLKGNHLLQFGGSWSRAAVIFNRNDGQVSSLTQPVYQITSSTGVNISGAYRPPTCTTTLVTDCLPSSQVSRWNNLYASALGLVDTASVLGTRNAQLQPNALGVPTSADMRYFDYSLYINDAWHLSQNVTLNFGLNWSADPPPTEISGKQSLMVYADNNKIVNPMDYLAAREQAALAGQVYNPVIGFAPIKSLHQKYPWNPVWSNFAPRVAVAWNPHFKGGGFLAKLFGEHETVIRGGYAMLYDRLNGVQKVINSLQGIGFQQTLTCVAPNAAGQCMGTGGTNPSTAFRIGTNGSTVPLPSITALTNIPLIPGTAAIPNATQAYIPSTYQMDPQYKPGRNQDLDFTLQRALSSTTTLEVGYIGHIAHGLYSPVQLNQVPYFMSYGNQTFASAFDAVATALRAGTPAASIAPQPFFEAALAGSSICSGQTSCTAGLIRSYSGNFTSSQVYTLWNNIQSKYTFGAATAATNQVGSMFFWAAEARSNYNAGFIALHQRNWKGLTLDANLTWAHSLDNTAGGIQDVDRVVANSYNLNYEYGNSIFDRKVVFNMYGLYQVPFGKGGHSFVDHLVQNWSVSPIWNWYSGLPLKVLVGPAGGNEFGTTNGPTGGAILLSSNDFGNSVHSGVTGDPSTGVATNDNPAKGGTGLNLFADPNSVFGSFRPLLLSQDSGATVSGQLRGQARWNVDMAIARKLQFRERISTTFSVQMFNVFNHVQFDDPAVSLQNPATFGVIGTQLNQPRTIELGVHFDF
jgi:hypothetical protein